MAKEYLDKSGLEYFWSKMKAAFAKKEDAGVILVTKSSITSLPITITDERILEEHVCIKMVLSNPSRQAGDWTITTSAGSLTISGALFDVLGSVSLYLAVKKD